MNRIRNGRQRPQGPRKHYYGTTGRKAEIPAKKEENSPAYITPGTAVEARAAGAKLAPGAQPGPPQMVVVALNPVHSRPGHRG
ncbi:hypothetical protein [Hymenobacter convexus]|uniref:hypothetical protein n=1 Tax=Hymenobacter sp. CA1UV-4 TaxID=3063782 RepID=UPI0027124A3C|nr:hypothetical protein [Hymenobacter sp. CA1UV-4]MDO7851832.1 hypothetical protein [Hymenobacter sp. CA1UV-4]